MTIEELVKAIEDSMDGSYWSYSYEEYGVDDDGNQIPVNPPNSILGIDGTLNVATLRKKLGLE